MYQISKFTPRSWGSSRERCLKSNGHRLWHSDQLRCGSRTRVSHTSTDCTGKFESTFCYVCVSVNATTSDLTRRNVSDTRRGLGSQAAWSQLKNQGSWLEGSKGRFSRLAGYWMRNVHMRGPERHGRDGSIIRVGVIQPERAGCKYEWGMNDWMYD